MGTKQAFKTYARTQRIQDTNLSFAKGMNFTDAPLVEGFSRLLVNFDFGGEGDTLKPRKGLSTVDLLTLGRSLGDDITIVDANQVMHNGVNYYQIIVGQLDKAPTNPNGGISFGNAWVITAYYNGAENVVKYAALNDLTSTQKCIFTNPQAHNASIHGLDLATDLNKEYIKKHIGTFAFNSAYYYFTTDGKLHYTYFDADPSVLQYKVQTITPYVPLQYETQNARYNMLLGAYNKDPYDFDCAIGGAVLALTGFAPGTHSEEDYSDWRLVPNPRSGSEYTYKLWYTYPKVGDNIESYYLRVEYTMGDNAWYTVPRDERQVYKADGNPFIIPHIKVDSSFAQFRIYAIPVSQANFAEADTQFTVEMLVKAVMLTTAFNYAGADREKSTDNLGTVRYNLSHARGITYWKNRLWLFGASEIRYDKNGEPYYKQDNTVLFASETNRPDWFAYPAAADIFDEEIIHLQPMLDELLVFTAHNLYSLTLDADGLGWTKKHLQANLNISPWDLNLIQIVKNMVFFKSGNYFYMVVPKLTAASGSGLAIAPVSKNIAGFLDNFSNTVEHLIDDVYNYSAETRFGNKSKVTYDYKLVHYYNYLDYEDVHNNYVFEVTQRIKTGYNAQESDYLYRTTTKLLTLSLLYNTVSRTWRIYTIESESILTPLLKDATSKGLYASIVPNTGNQLLIQILRFDGDTCRDAYIQGNQSNPSPAVLFPNWQYLDSGNLDQNSDMKKRFREYQFKIVNETNNALEFYSGFYLDKATRTYEMSYTQESLEDVEAQEQVTIIDAIPAVGMQGDPNKRIGEKPTDEVLYQYTKLGSWKLGVSIFPKVTSWKVRVPTSGKGYLPRLILISYNQTSYELLSCATVYRQLYSR